MPKNKQVNPKDMVFHREASFKPASVDKDSRTVVLCWGSEVPVERYDYELERWFLEVLSMEPSAVDLSRLSSGKAPLLVTHQSRNLDAQVGVIDKAWVQEKSGFSLVRFSKRSTVEDLFQDVSDGIIQNVSVGYVVSQYEIMERSGEIPIYTAVRWQPFENSLVPVPADPSASTRSAEDGFEEICADTLLTRAVAQTEESLMPKENTGGSPAEIQAPAIDQRAIASEATAAERERQKQIRQAARALSVEEAVVDEMIEKGISSDDARTRMIDLHARAAEAQRIVAPPTIKGSERASGDDPSVIGQAMAEAIAARYSNHAKPSDHARQFMGHSVSDLVSDLLRANGFRLDTRNKAELIGKAMSFRAAGMHGTSDFAGVLLNAANKILLSEYTMKPQSYTKLSRKRNFTDFKPHNFVRLGDFPDLLEVGESGEFKYGRLQDGKESIALATYGRVIGLSRQSLINDDLGAFADMTSKIGRRCASFENSLFYKLLTSNSGMGPELSDGVTMFDDKHGNVAETASAIDVEHVALGRSAIRQQKGLADPKDKKSKGIDLNLEAKYIVVGPKRELQALRICTPTVAVETGEVNPYARSLEAIVDASISDYGWYMLTDPGDAEAFVHGWLEGQEGPRVETRNGFDTDGIEFKVAEDFAVGGVDFRPGYFNAGAAG